MSEMNRPDLEAMRERCEAATPGPWEPAMLGPGGTIKAVVQREQDGDWAPVAMLSDDDGWESYNEEADRPFIAHAREDIPTLLAYTERLEEEVERLRGLLRNVLEASAIAIESCPSPYDAMGLCEVRDEALIRRGTSIADVTRAALNQQEKTDD